MKFTPKLLIKLAIGAAMVMSMLTFQGVHATATLAASQCSGAANCNGMDPTTTLGPHNIYCNQNAYLQEHKDFSFGWIENWWSAECNANWTIANVNSGYIIDEAEATSCSSGAGTTPSGWKCDPGAFTRVCDYFNNLRFICGDLDPYNFGDMPANTTHWYTNMVRGDVRTISVASVECSGCITMNMQTGWH